MMPEIRKTIYRCSVGGDKERMKLEDIPEEYLVEECDTHSGIVIWGKYSGDRWIMNPPCRDLVAHLIRMMK